jgi:hypothetical protein
MAALDRRFHDLAVRLERHTSEIASGQGRRFDQLDERVRLDLRVVDEHLLAIRRATPAGPVDGGVGALLGSAASGLLLVAPPGAALGSVPTGYRIAGVSSFTAARDGGWTVVDGDERTDTLRIARLEPSP